MKKGKVNWWTEGNVLTRQIKRILLKMNKLNIKLIESYFCLSWHNGEGFLENFEATSFGVLISFFHIVLIT